MSLSFEEFRAIENRNRKSNTDKTVTASGPTPSPPAPTGPTPLGPATSTGTGSGLIYSIGEFLESYQMQLLCIVLIVLDTYCSFAVVYLSSAAAASSTAGEVFREATEGAGAGAQQGKGGLGRWAILRNLYMFFNSKRDIIQTALTSFTQFTIFFFCLEVAAIFVAFGWSAFGHLGYVLDAFIVWLQLYLEIKGFGRETRLLNVFRLWRLARLFGFLIDIEKYAHEQTRQQVGKIEFNYKKLDMDYKQAKIEVKNEKEARDSIEEMLQNYKDEVDTLNEALKIAAMDIAEVAQANDEDLLSDDDVDEEGEIEEEGLDDELTADDSLSQQAQSQKDLKRQGASSEGDDEAGFVDAPISAYDRSVNRESLFRLAQRDMRSKRTSGASTASVASAGSSGMGTTTQSATGGVTFLINSDGSFQKK